MTKKPYEVEFKNIKRQYFIINTYSKAIKAIDMKCTLTEAKKEANRLTRKYNVKYEIL